MSRSSCSPWLLTVFCSLISLSCLYSCASAVPDVGVGATEQQVSSSSSKVATDEQQKTGYRKARMLTEGTDPASASDTPASEQAVEQWGAADDSVPLGGVVDAHDDAASDTNEGDFSVTDAGVDNVPAIKEIEFSEEEPTGDTSPVLDSAPVVEPSENDTKDEAAAVQTPGTSVLSNVAVQVDDDQGPSLDVPAGEEDPAQAAAEGRRRPSACKFCVPVSSCAFAVNQQQDVPTCNLSGGQMGVCCPRKRKNQSQSSSGARSGLRLLEPQRRLVTLPVVTASHMDASAQEGKQRTSDMLHLERHLIATQQTLKRGTAAHGHMHFFRITPQAMEQHLAATTIMHCSVALSRKMGLTHEQRVHGLQQLAVRGTALEGMCPVIPVCDPSTRYRSATGACNNLDNPLWGSSNTPFLRISPPLYDDGINTPHSRSVTGAPLPLPRTVSSAVLPDRDVPDRRFTLAVMQWAQFIDHDLTHAPFPSLVPNVEGVECCVEGEEVTGPDRHPSCFPIMVNASDPFFGPRGQHCLNFVRSMLAPSQNCTFGVAEQLNQITQFLDSSNVYGSTEDQAVRLRVNESGLLLTSEGNLLPFDLNRTIECDARERGALCYFAGDSRVNEMPGLTTMHILFHREHNRVALGLEALNPSWEDERIYQEARKIVSSTFQHIVYNEWLPIIIGPSFAEQADLLPLQNGFLFDYDPTINPNIHNEFATGAFRFGHTLVQGIIALMDEDEKLSVLRLRNHFNSPHIFQARQGVVDMFARALIREPPQQYDSFITADLSNHLFQTPVHDFGMDLMSLNLQRARDHGIGSYNDIRQACGLTRARTFSDFNDQIPMNVIVKLMEVYEHPDDVELFMGGITEKSAGDALLGFTFRCVVADEFARAKRADRFFYERGGQPGSFTAAQLNEIRRTSWARIICDNTDTVRMLQPLAFRAEDDGLNARQSCDGGGIPSVDLSPWQE